MADKYVPIFLDWTEVTEELNDAEKGRLIDAIVCYARGGSWQEVLEGNERYLFPAFRRQIDRQNEISSIRAASGEKSKTKQNEQNEAKVSKKSKTKQNEANSNKIANKYKYEYEEENKYEYENNISANADKITRTRFVPPTVEQVREYVTAQKYHVDADAFVAWYASNGWRVGAAKNPMRDWQAAVRTWERKDMERNAIGNRPKYQPGTQPGGSDRPAPTADDVERMKRFLEKLKGEENETENVG